MEIIPAIDIKNGKCIQLVQGKPGTEQISIENPVKVAITWEQEGAPRLHVIDLDGAIEGQRKNTKFIREIIASVSIPVQVGGGIRTYEDALSLFEIGADRIILGTAAIKNPKLVEDLSKQMGPEHVMGAVDSKGGKVLIKGWQESTEFSTIELAKLFEKSGAGSILFTNVEVEGKLEGLDPRPIEDLVQSVKIPVIASGGITKLDDIATLAKAGAQGAIIGLALYKKNFSLKEALEIGRITDC